MLHRLPKLSSATSEHGGLERIGDRWVVGEEQWPVRPDAIEVLLETLRKVTLKHFVQQSAVEQVNQRMEVYGRWVEVYAGDQSRTTSSVQKPRTCWGPITKWRVQIYLLQCTSKGSTAT